MDWLRRLWVGLGGVRPSESRPVVWVDCALAGVADRGHAVADLVIVPAWPDRLQLVRGLAARSDVRVVLEREAGDPAFQTRVAGLWAVVTWLDGPARGCVVEPEDVRSLLGVDDVP